MSIIPMGSAGMYLCSHLVKSNRKSLCYFEGWMTKMLLVCVCTYSTNQRKALIACQRIVFSSTPSNDGASLS